MCGFEGSGGFVCLIDMKDELNGADGNLVAIGELNVIPSGNGFPADLGTVGTTEILEINASVSQCEFSVLPTDIGHRNSQLAVFSSPNDRIAAQRHLFGAGLLVDDFKPYVHVNRTDQDGMRRGSAVKQPDELSMIASSGCHPQTALCCG